LSTIVVDLPCGVGGREAGQGDVVEEAGRHRRGRDPARRRPAILRAKPSSSKGRYLKKVVVSTLIVCGAVGFG
jgi:hypothetical protein